MTISERKEREKELRRMQIITAAENLFFRSGYDHVSMEEIARAAELSKGTIFFYFKNKETLFITIVLRGIRLFYEMVSDACEKYSDSLSDQLRTMGEVVIMFSREYPGYLSAIRLFKSGRFSLEKQSETGEETREILQYSRRLSGFMENIVREGIQKRVFRDDIDPIELGIIIRMLTGSVMDINPEIRWMLREHTISEEKIIDTFFTLMTSMIAGKKTSDINPDMREYL